MKISVNQYDLSPKFAFAGTKGSYGLDAVIYFCFSEEWNGLSKTVSFYPADGSTPVAEMITENEPINIPSEIMNVAGQSKYVVSGVDGTDTIISVTGILQVATTLDCVENTSQTPTPTLMAQVYEKMAAAQDAAEAAEDAAKEAEEYVEEQQVSSAEARAYTESALAAKTAAETASGISVAAKDLAVSAKEVAVSSKTDAVSAKDAAVSAKTDAVSAKTDAVSAKNAAVAAKTAAEAAAASIDVSGKMNIVTGAGVGNMAVFDATGNVKDGKIALFVDEDGILNIRFDEEE